MKIPEAVGERRVLTLLRPAELEIIQAAANNPDAREIGALRALLPQLKTFVWGRGMMEQDFRFPDGTMKSFHLWHAPGKRSVILFPVTKDRKVVVIRQWRPAAAMTEPENSVITELPGGNPNGSQTPEEVADMELLEETGYRAERWIRLSKQMLWWEPAALTTRYVPLIGLGCEKIAKPKPDETEVILESTEIPVNDWISMVLAGEIRDSKSIVLTFLSIPYLELCIR